MSIDEKEKLGGIELQVATIGSQVQHQSEELSELKKTLDSFSSWMRGLVVTILGVAFACGGIWFQVAHNSELTKAHAEKLELPRFTQTEYDRQEAQERAMLAIQNEYQNKKLDECIAISKSNEKKIEQIKNSIDKISRIFPEESCGEIKEILSGIKCEE